jgi:4-amino-4-deoxy-L-arabinose transferase-like glycosyltransferase
VQSSGGSHAALIVLMIALAFAAIVRLRLADLPLERDEGEYAYAGQLMLQGIPPYSLAYNMKFPGTYAAYALIMALFGQTVTAIRIGLLLVNAATTILLYLLVKRRFDTGTALVAAVSFVLLSLEPTIAGIEAHATHFLILPVVGALLLLTPVTPSVSEGPGRAGGAPPAPPAASLTLGVTAAGALFGIAILMKQHAIAFALFPLVLLLARKRWRDVALLFGGGAIVGAITAAILATAGVFGRFWFWTIEYAREYVTSAAAADAADLFALSVKSIFGYEPLLWILAAAGLVILFVDERARREWPFVIGFLVAAILAILPGLYFRIHYFIVLLPVAAILIGIAVGAGTRVMPRAIPPIAFVIAVLATLGPQWNALFNMAPNDLSRALHGDNPFAEAVEVARYVEEHTAPNERIAVVGSEPEIYFLSHRKSATGYIYTYPLMEHQQFAHRMQEEMIREIEAAKPRYLIMVGVKESWLAKPDSDRTLFEWVQKEMQRGWTLDGIVDIQPNGTRYTWGAEAPAYQTKTRSVIQLFRRVP